jgi:hypothetical protein
LGLGSVRAQAPGNRGSDYLDQVRRLKEVELQKTEADVRLALRTATRLAATEPTKAVERLQQTITQVENSTVLSDARRSTLKRMLQDRIRVTESLADRAAARAAEAVAKRGTAAERRADQDYQTTEGEKVRRVLQQLREMQREGRNGDASRLAQGQSNNPAVRAADRINAIKDQIAANRQVQDERAGRTGGALRDVDRSGMPPKGDLEYARDWKERTKNRTGSTTVQLTAKERAIFQALDSPIPAEFKDSPLDAVLDYLMAYTGLVIVADKRALDDAQVTSDTRVTANLKGATLRTVLRKVLGDLGLTYVIKEEAIQVVTPLQAKSMLVARVYYVGDLIANFDPVVTVLNAAYLIDLIQRTIEPASWQINGGAGTITFEPITMSLVIKQSSEFHGVLGSGLTSGLRR